MKKLLTYLQGDRVIWIACIFLSIFSILAVYSSISSLAYKYKEGDTFYYLLKHALMIFSGFGLMYIAHRIEFRFYARISQVLLWVAVFLLAITLVFGANINSASRWLTIPIINQNFQTSDFAKIILVAYVARMLTIKREKLSSFREGVLPVLIPVGIVCGLILPANFSTAAVLFSTCLVIMFIGGVKVHHLLMVVGTGVGVFLILLLLAVKTPNLLPRLGTWKQRIESYRGGGDAEESYQVEHAMMAIHSGGILPKGPGTGDSRNYLPHPYSDMIYAFIIEEYGSILGGIGILLLYLIILYRALRIANSCEMRFGSLLVTGLGFQIVFQAMINMGVAVHVLPVTGQPLPLVSMGGTSVWFTSIAIGMILSVSRSVEMPETQSMKGGAHAIA